MRGPPTDTAPTRSRPLRRTARSRAAPLGPVPPGRSPVSSLSFVAGFDERAHVAELLVAVGAQVLGLQVVELLEVAPQRFAQGLRRRVVIAVGAARRLGH